MSSHPKLKNPPIHEALLDFRVKLDSNFDVALFADLASEVGQEYPTIEERSFFRSQLGVDKQRGIAAIPRESGKHGYWYKSKDNTQIAQFRIDGFTFNKLKPYDTWEEVFIETKRLWSIYKKIAEPEAITRVSTRYINHISLPKELIDLDEYLTIAPVVPEKLPQLMERYLSQFTIHNPETGIHANVTQALLPSQPIIILDIETYKSNEAGFAEEELWNTLKILRAMKNDIFFESITKKLQTRYQQ